MRQMKGKHGHVVIFAVCRKRNSKSQLQYDTDVSAGGAKGPEPHFLSKELRLRGIKLLLIKLTHHVIFFVSIFSLVSSEDTIFIFHTVKISLPDFLDKLFTRFKGQ